MKVLLALSLLFPAAASAAQFSFNKHVEPGLLFEQLRAAGFTPESMQCAGDNCKLTYQGAGNPQAVINAHVYVNPETQHAQRVDQLKTLAKKVKAGTATQQEKDDLLVLLVRLLVNVD